MILKSGLSYPVFIIGITHLKLAKKGFWHVRMRELRIGRLPSSLHIPNKGRLQGDPPREVGFRGCGLLKSTSLLHFTQGYTQCLYGVNFNDHSTTENLLIKLKKIVPNRSYNFNKLLNTYISIFYQKSKH